MYSEQEAEKAYQQQFNQGQTASNSYGTCTGTIGVQSAKEELLIHRLRRKQISALSEEQKLSRAIDILERHPEFQEFLELLHSGFAY